MAEVTFAPAGEVIALDFWSAPDPGHLEGLNAFQVEPRLWWLLGADPQREQLASIASMTPIGGGLVRATVSGTGWRDLLSIAGSLDLHQAEIGTALSSVIHHVPVTLVPVQDDMCHVYLPASYAHSLSELWSRSVACDTSALTNEGIGG